MNGAEGVPIEIAARLIGVTGDRVRQLIKAGHAVSPGRGMVNLPSLLRGYTAQLRAAAARPSSAALARHQKSKAALIAEDTAQRRAELIERLDAEAAVAVIAQAAVVEVQRLARPSSAALKSLPADLAARFRAEASAAAEAISEAQEVALTALRTGEFGEIVK